MSKWFKSIVLFCITIALLFACNSSNNTPTSNTSPLRVAYNLWPGDFPLVIAQEKGFFQKRGISVEAIYTEHKHPQIADFYAGKYDGTILTLGDIIGASGNKPDIGVVLAIDDSVGGDAIIASPEIKNIAQLKGKTIGATLGGFGELLVEQMLKTVNLNRNDVTLVKIDANQVIDRLKTKQIQAGQTWEPYVSRAKKTGNRVLFTSLETPGLITDVITFRGSILRERSKEVKAFIQAFLDAIEYWEANVTEGNEIIAKTLKIPVSEISLQGIKLLKIDDNLQVFDRQNANSLYKNAELYIDFYIRTGSLGSRPDLDKLIDSSFLPR
jgi:NitT/TauT family transport system substrate-binding protein